jgi:hypothetical protein
MRCRLVSLALVLALVAPLFGQESSATPAATPQRRSWFGRVLHPFSSSPRIPQYNDPKLRGLVLELQIAPQPVKLSEVRQLEVRATLTNLGKHPVTLDFATDQRVEIYLRNSAETILTKWSDNHATNENPGTIVLNPQERIEYLETIATRELTPNKVFIADVFFSRYPELRARQKFMTAP